MFLLCSTVLYMSLFVMVLFQCMFLPGPPSDPEPKQEQSLDPPKTPEPTDFMSERDAELLNSLSE